MSAREQINLEAFSERARKAFDLRVGNLYQESIRSVNDLKESYQNEGIASAGKYLRKTFDSLINDFQGIEAAFHEIYLEPFSREPVTETEELWLRQAAAETVDRETVRIRNTFQSLASSFVGAASDRVSSYVAQFDQQGQLTKHRLNTSIELLRPDRSGVARASAPQEKKRPAWLPVGWSIVRSLNEGGQGWTYLVRPTTAENGPLFVLKRLKNRNRADRFAAEIKALQKLSHPGILTIIDAGEADGAPYYVAEYCEDGDLSRWEPARWTLLEKLRAFRQIANAVSAAHDAGIIHRDLKPLNILQRSNGSLAVGDFGLCIHLNDMDGRLTTLNEPVGPRNYIAPELEDGRIEDPEPSADVYSLGKLLYFMLTSRSFSREKHRIPPFDLLHPERGEIEAGVHFVYDVLYKAIVADPGRRYRDATALREAIEGVMMKIETGANVLDLSVPQQCWYCREGHYRVMQGTSPDQWNLKLVCSNCGNLQEFVSQNTVAKNWWSGKR